MEEGEVAQENPPLTVPEEYETDAQETMSFVTGAIMDEPLNPEMAKSLSRMYTLHTAKRLGEILAEREDGGPKMLSGFKQTLEEAVEDSSEGDFSDISRFLKVEAERLGAGADPKVNQYAPLGNKIRDMVELLPKAS